MNKTTGDYKNPAHLSSSLTPIDQALAQLLKSLPSCQEVITVPLLNAVGRVLAEDIVATLNVPPHHNSAMDGYAVRSADVQSTAVTLQVTQRIPAGRTGVRLKPGQAARIFTGAPLPPDADAVVMQENTEVEQDRVLIKQAVQAGQNIRLAGEDIKQGSLLFQQGHRIRSRDLGLLATVGLFEVKVSKALKVAVLTTGDELVRPGTRLGPGQIYNSNFFTLAGLLDQMDMEVVDCGIVADDLLSTEKALAEAARSAHCVISSGGVSVGEEDYVKAAVQKNGKLELWKLAIKPGKPFAWGTVFDKPFFGLPGNPVSAFVTFMLMVKPGLLTMQTGKYTAPSMLTIPAGFEQKESGQRQEYLRVKLVADGKGSICLIPCTNQSSGVYSSVNFADGLAIVPPFTAVSKGSSLNYISFAELMQ